jgi:hypothetical protein
MMYMWGNRTFIQIRGRVHLYCLAELKDLAAESLALLAAGLPRQAAAFPALLSLPVYGALISMFELNNLGGQCLTALPKVPSSVLSPMLIGMFELKNLGGGAPHALRANWSNHAHFEPSQHNPLVIMEDIGAGQSCAACTSASVSQRCKTEDGQQCCVLVWRRKQSHLRSSRPAGVMVASPVEDYFLHLDGLPEPDRSAAMAVARPLLVQTCL